MEIRRQPSEKSDYQRQPRLHFQENSSDFIEDSPTQARGGDRFEENNIKDSRTPARGGEHFQQEKMDDELALIENAFEYLTKKTCPSRMWHTRHKKEGRYTRREKWRDILQEERRQYRKCHHYRTSYSVKCCTFYYATNVHNDTIVLILAGQADCEQTREGENSVLMPSASCIGASGNEENSVMHNRTIHVDGSDQRCHWNGILYMMNRIHCHNNHVSDDCTRF